MCSTKCKSLIGLQTKLNGFGSWQWKHFYVKRFTTNIFSTMSVCQYICVLFFNTDTVKLDYLLSHFIYFSIWCYGHWFLPLFSVINLCKCSYAYWSHDKMVYMNQNWTKYGLKIWNHNKGSILKMFYIDVIRSYDDVNVSVLIVGIKSEPGTFLNFKQTKLSVDILDFQCKWLQFVYLFIQGVRPCFYVLQDDSSLLLELF